MQSYKVVFRKPYIKIITLGFALTALACSVILSQSNSPNYDKKKKAQVKIYSSSKSGGPDIQKEKSPESLDSGNAKTKQSENDKKKEDGKKEQFMPVMPSSKAPDPVQY